jgi:hypothetical protein
MQTNQPKEEKKKPERPPLLLIEWYDAHHEFGWMDGNDGLEPVDIPLVYSVGWLMSQNEKGIRICQSWTDDNHAQTLTIPAKMIERVSSLGPSVLDPMSAPTKSTAKPTTKRTKQPI